MSGEHASSEPTSDGGEAREERRSSSDRRSDGGTVVGDGGAEAGGDVVREIGHDEFDPVGTLALIVVYLAVLVAMWFFMYFVEFLGNGPTVVG